MTWKCNKPLDLSRQHKRTPSLSPCVTTPPLGKQTRPCASGNGSLSCPSGWRRFHCFISSIVTTSMTSWLLFSPSTVTVTFWLLGLRQQAWRATFPPPTPPRWLTSKSQGKAEAFNGGGGSLSGGRRLGLLRRPLHEWRLGSLRWP